MTKERMTTFRHSRRETCGVPTSRDPLPGDDVWGVKQNKMKKQKQVPEITKQQELDSLTIKERLTAPTPKFFKKLKIIGLALAATAGALIAAPIALPAAVITIAGYIAIAGTVASAVSQVTVES